MWTFITWLIGWIYRVKGNPIATGIIQAVGGIMAALPPGSVSRALELVKTAAADDSLINTAKFNYVYGVLQNEFPGIERNMLNTLINAVLEAIRKGFV
jgi:hypothetical protein